MLIKWLAAVFQHGLVSVFALIVAIAAVWWVEPTTNGGIAFLLLVAFLLALTAFELIRKLAGLLRPAKPAVDAPAPATAIEDAAPETEAPASIPRRRKRRRTRG